MGNKRTIKKIPISELVFDTENPRLPTSLHNNADDIEIITWMVQNAKLVELLTSIANQGFFGGEPLLVYEDDKGRCVVVEGNRRLAAVKLLHTSPHLLTA